MTSTAGGWPRILSTKAWNWATFPNHLAGRLAAFAFAHVLNGVEKDREHARTELRYLKGLIERP